MVVTFGAGVVGFGAEIFFPSAAVTCGVVAVDLSASRAKDCGAGVLASFTLEAIVNTFAAAAGGTGATGAAGLSATAFLPSIVELNGEFFWSGVTGEVRAVAPFAAGDLLIFLSVSLPEFIFMFMFT